MMIQKWDILGHTGEPGRGPLTGNTFPVWCGPVAATADAIAGGLRRLRAFSTAATEGSLWIGILENTPKWLAKAYELAPAPSALESGPMLAPWPAVLNANSLVINNQLLHYSNRTPVALHEAAPGSAQGPPAHRVPHRDGAYGGPITLE